MSNRFRDIVIVALAALFLLVGAVAYFDHAAVAQIRQTLKWHGMAIEEDDKTK